MFTNYSQTYASAILTLAGTLGLFLNKYGITNSDIELVLSSIATLGGIIWTLTHRKSKGDVSVLGFRK